MSQFRELFEAYGADYELTMSRFLGDETKYLRFLDLLFLDDNLQTLGDALAAGDLDGAFGAAHTLKGISGNLGLTPLYNAVCEIVAPLRLREGRDDYPVMYQAIQLEFRKVDLLRRKLKGEE